MSINEIKEAVSAGTLKQLHTSRSRGYQSRKGIGTIVAYKGKFGEGFAHYSPAWDSTSYCFVTYYVK